jgi:hypothetical protein
LAQNRPEGHHESARGAACGHHAVQLAHHVDADLQGAPLLALNQEHLAAVLARPAQHDVHTTVGAAPACFHNLVALQAKALADQELELAPAHAIERVARLALRDVGNETPAHLAAPCRQAGSCQADDRQDVLAGAGKPLPQRLRDHGPLPGLGGDGQRRCRKRMKQQVAQQRKEHANPPRQHGDQFDEVFGRTGLLASGHCSFMLLGSLLYQAAWPPNAGG